jgi:hypothetical protein
MWYVIVVLLTLSVFSCKDLNGFAPYVGPIYWPLSSLQNQSVNNATATYSNGLISIAGLSNTTVPVGSFVGGGTGHKPILGVPGFHQLKLSNLKSISYESKLNSGVLPLYLNLQIDLDCNLNEDITTALISDIRLNRKIIVVNLFTATPVDSGYTEYKVQDSDSMWSIVGGPIGGLPAHTSGTGAALTTFLITYPNVCVIDGTVTDGGLKRNASNLTCVTGAGLPTSAPAYCGATHSGILVLAGGSTSIDLYQHDLRRVIITTKDPNIPQNIFQ